MMATRRPLGWAAVALLAAAACGGTTKPPDPKPPKVSLSPIAREIVGTGFDVVVAVSGCEKVSRVWLTEHDSVLAQQDGGGTSNTLAVKASYVDYKARGVPAYLAIFGHATCDTGLQGDSEEQATEFLPAQEVIAGPLPFGPNFWVEEDAATMLTCDGGTVRRVAKDKSVKASLSLPIGCSGAAELTFGQDGKRYLLEPGVGAVGFTAGLQQTMFASESDFSYEQIVAPVGGPLVALGKYGPVYHQLRGYDPATSAQVSISDPTDATPAGRIVVNRLGQVVLPGHKSQTGSDFVDVGIELYDMKAGRGQLVADRAFGKIRVDPLFVTPIPTISFDQNADLAFFAEIADPSHVWACSAVDDLTCTDGGGGLKWKSPDLVGGVTQVTRTVDALVAFGPRVAYFLDPITGAQITTTDRAITPQGGLVFVAAVGGGDGSTYLLAMGVDGAGHLEAGIKEIIVYDRPDKKVADYLTATDGYIVDVDKTGRAWLWSYALTPLLMAADYRAAIGN